MEIRWILACICIANASLGTTEKGNSLEQSSLRRFFVNNPFAFGCLMSFAETTANQKNIYDKNMLELGLKYDFLKKKDPKLRIPFLPSKKCFRGYGLNLISMAPTVGLQTSCYEKLKPIFQYYQTPFWGDLNASFWAGAASAVIGCPSELITLHKQKTGFSYSSTCKMIYKHGGIKKFYKGLGLTAFLYNSVTMSFFTVVPYLNNTGHLSHIQNEEIRFFITSLGVGALLAVTTQPFDVVKTLRQNDLKNEHYKGTLQTIKLLLDQKKISVFFPGVAPATLRLIFSVVIQALGMKYYNSMLNSEKNTRQ